MEEDASNADDNSRADASAEDFEEGDVQNSPEGDTYSTAESTGTRSAQNARNNRVGSDLECGVERPPPPQPNKRTNANSESESGGESSPPMPKKRTFDNSDSESGEFSSTSLHEKLNDEKRESSSKPDELEKSVSSGGDDGLKLRVEYFGLEDKEYKWVEHPYEGGDIIKFMLGNRCNAQEI